MRETFGNFELFIKTHFIVVVNFGPFARYLGYLVDVLRHFANFFFNIGCIGQATESNHSKSNVIFGSFRPAVRGVCIYHVACRGSSHVGLFDVDNETSGVGRHSEFAVEEF